jgi:plasmid stabilization system protein ParE
MPYRVEITDAALDEITRAVAWLAERSPAAAERWRQSLFSVIDTLSADPTRYSLAPEDDWHRGGIRQLLLGKRRNIYRVLFRIRGQVVQVLRVRHGAQALLEPGDLPEG